VSGRLGVALRVGLASQPPVSAPSFMGCMGRPVAPDVLGSHNNSGIVDRGPL
jgi:hypothetical protein